MTAYVLRARGESLPDVEAKCITGGCRWPGSGRGTGARLKAQNHAVQTGHLVAVTRVVTEWWEGAAVRQGGHDGLCMQPYDGETCTCGASASGDQGQTR